jgi:hypothetical protein
MLRILSVIALGIVISTATVACSSGPAVRTPEQAIAIGWKACDDSWGKTLRQNGQTFQFRPEIRHARLVGDHWRVWSGSDEANPGMHVDVPTDGRRPDGETECHTTLAD